MLLASGLKFVSSNCCCRRVTCNRQIKQPQACYKHSISCDFHYVKQCMLASDCTSCCTNLVQAAPWSVFASAYTCLMPWLSHHNQEGDSSSK